MSSTRLDSPTQTTRLENRRVLAILVVWGALAALASLSGFISTATPRPVFPLMILVPTLGFIVTLARSDVVRGWVRGLDLRIPILYNAARAFFGAAFLVLEARGAIDVTFARIAGPGDIVAGAGAFLAAACVPLASERRRAIVLGWNVLALADMLLVIGTAQSIVFFGGGLSALSSLASFPFSMLPAFVVPLVLITHVIIFVRLAELPPNP